MSYVTRIEKKKIQAEKNKKNISIESEEKEFAVEIGEDFIYEGVLIASIWEGGYLIVDENFIECIRVFDRQVRLNVQRISYPCREISGIVLCTLKHLNSN